MKIARKHSHLNGEEWLLVHGPELHQEIFDTISAVDAEKCRTKLSAEKKRRGEYLYSPKDLNFEFDRLFSERGWESTRYSYYIAHDIEQFGGYAESLNARAEGVSTDAECRNNSLV